MQFPSTYNLAGNLRLVEDQLTLDLINFRSYTRPDIRSGVEIQNDVWVGRDVCIMNGVKLGNGCLIGTRALVTKSCEPYGVYGGVPARLIRYRFPRAVVQQLLEIQWWNWSWDKIQMNTTFLDTDLTSFTGDLREIIQE